MIIEAEQSDPSGELKHIISYLEFIFDDNSNDHYLHQCWPLLVLMRVVPINDRRSEERFGCAKTVSIL